MSDPEAVRGMFSAISPRYDLLNHLLSMGLDVSWRRKAVRLLAPSPGDVVLDLCGGTGDLALEAMKTGARVICLDFSGPMLARARRKFARSARREVPVGHAGDGAAAARLVLADALRLPFPDRALDGVLVGFGLRNLRSLEEGLDEIRRVLRPGAKACVLEFSRPSGPLAGVYGHYLARVLPRAGDLISGRRGPYQYLARTIRGFPPAEALGALMSERGFLDVRWRTLSGGIVAVHTGRRPA
jgi:demethylmenaquinone methyltransferase/2-methoxy-6-polyprenyl-1,4-benzoquinol methylase